MAPTTVRVDVTVNAEQVKRVLDACSTLKDALDCTYPSACGAMPRGEALGYLRATVKAAIKGIADALSDKSAYATRAACNACSGAGVRSWTEGRSGIMAEFPCSHCQGTGTRPAEPLA